MQAVSRYHYLPVDGAELFTMVFLPEEQGKFPSVIMRSPYVDHEEHISEDEICANRMRDLMPWLENGYAVVFQHCRGRGKSSGDCVPYVYERADGLAMHDWIRQQSFYNGELYLQGGSYTSSVHYVTAPWADDIKGAVLEKQDTERYNCNYRNGFYKIGLAGGWYAGMYKKKSIFNKAYVTDSFKMLPLSAFSETIFGEKAPGYDDIFMHPDKNDPFWKETAGLIEDSGAVRNTKIPVLLTTAFYDIYTGGIFDMWNAMEPETRKICALAVNPYDHGGNPNGQPVAFPKGMLREHCGAYAIKWLNYVRGLEPAPVEPGKVTYYKLFGEQWCCDDFETSGKQLSFTLGEGEKTYRYNPYAPATFKGGLSANFGGTAWQDPPNSRYDILSFHTPEFAEDVFVKGKMSAKLRVRSTCEDTCFYVRLSLVKPEGDYGLRDDILAISNVKSDYVPGTEVELNFSFDEHAFVIKKGEKIRIDVSSSAFPLYVPHTNQKGLFSEQTTAKIADNTVICEKSVLFLPAE